MAEQNKKGLNMFSRQMKGLLDQLGIHFSWFMASIAFLVIFFSSASLATPGILMVEITKDLGWSIGDVSLAIGVLFLTVALAAPFGAALMAIIGLTKVVVISGALVILGLSKVMVSFKDSLHGHSVHWKRQKGQKAVEDLMVVGC